MRDEVLALFRELADLSPEARARYFEEHRVDPDVRAEVESLLAFDAPSGSLADPIAREAKGLLQPTSLGPYRTVRDLGEHGKGVIHRDLNPSTILMAKTRGVGAPKGIDFGVAKVVNLRLTERTVCTEMGMLIGTPEYMSPEQAGDAEAESTTDIYSLGVVL